MNFKVNKKENFYFILKVVFTLLVILALAATFSSLSKISTGSLVPAIQLIIIYAVFIWLFIVFQKIFLIAYLKGNGIEICEEQFSEFYANYQIMADKLNIKKKPKLFIIQQGGLLNAFAVKFSGKNYIAIYSDIFGIIDENEDIVKFVIGHELGHVKRKHLEKRFWTFPSLIIHFLESAYSRSCEYTCDNIGHSLAPVNSINGLLVLAAGKDIYKKVNMETYIRKAKENYTTAVKFAGIFMTHPYLPKRIENIIKQ